MYTFSADMKSVCLNLRSEMIDHNMEIVPRMLTVDVPLRFATLPEKVQKAILQELAAEASVPEQDICRETIAVDAGIACTLDGASVDMNDEIDLIVCAKVVTKDGSIRTTGTILDGVDTYVDEQANNRKAFVSHIMGSMRACVLSNNDTKFDVELIVP